jgi:hypothetical protein
MAAEGSAREPGFLIINFTRNLLESPIIASLSHFNPFQRNTDRVTEFINEIDDQVIHYPQSRDVNLDRVLSISKNDVDI